MDIGKNDTSFDFELTYEGIEGGSVTQAHIHVGQPNVAGGIVVFLCTNGAPPAGVPVPAALSGFPRNGDRDQDGR
jgi:hypothetical protein